MTFADLADRVTCDGTSLHEGSHGPFELSVLTHIVSSASSIKVYRDLVQGLLVVNSRLSSELAIMLLQMVLGYRV